MRFLYSRQVRRLLCVSLLVICAVWYYLPAFTFTQSFANRRNRVIFTINGPNTTDAAKACVHPQLEMWHSSVRHFFTKMPDVKCSEKQDWVFTDKGTFRISKEVEKRVGRISCQYTPQLRGNDDYKVYDGKTIYNMTDGTPLPSDFFEVRCRAANNETYVNVHAGISAKPTPVVAKHSEGNMGLNVLMFGFDSISKMTWQRLLPKTHSYLVNTLGGIVLDGYNIVGDGTPQALLPILTGKTELELPDARRGKPGAVHVNGHPWIWNNFKKVGSMTQYGEDCPGIGTFTYRMLGFKEPPVDHYVRTFFLKAQQTFNRHKPMCLGSVPRHMVMLNYVKEFFKVYPKQQKFSFLFNSEVSHGHASKLQIVDNDLRSYVEKLNREGELNNTVLMLMSDHGARFDGLRKTVQGKIEERMPYMSFRFPPWFEQKYPTAMKNFRTNVHRLSTPFDLHATFEDMLDYKEEPMGNIKERGISLFREIPPERTCKDADIEPHWCACMKWEKADVTHKNTRAAVGALVDIMNNITAAFRDQCEPLTLHEVSSAVKFEPNKDVLKFKRSSDNDGYKADLSDKMKASEILYQVTVKTKPGDGLFEATIKHLLRENKYVADYHSISRINKYGLQPHCVMKRYPHLRQFCYCKVQL